MLLMTRRQTLNAFADVRRVVHRRTQKYAIKVQLHTPRLNNYASPTCPRFDLGIGQCCPSKRHHVFRKISSLKRRGKGKGTQSLLVQVRQLTAHNNTDASCGHTRIASAYPAAINCSCESFIPIYWCRFMRMVISA